MGFDTEGCNELPGHSRCSKKVEAGKCIGVSEGHCVGKRRVTGADVPTAEGFISAQREIQRFAQVPEQAVLMHGGIHDKPCSSFVNITAWNNPCSS